MRVSLHGVVVVSTLLASAGVLRADPNSDQLKATYDETVRQLQQSQDRKNQLANENEQLKAKISELQGKLNAIDAQAKQAEFLRSQFVAWSTFLEQYPLLLKRFQNLAQSSSTSSTIAPPEPFFDPEWPFSTAGRIEDDSASLHSAMPESAQASIAATIVPQSNIVATADVVATATIAATANTVAAPATQPSTMPTTMPMLVQMFHGGPNHWCAVCAAAAAKKAEADRPSGDNLAPPPQADLMQDLPQR